MNAETPPTVAGYRVVRTLARDDDAEVLLLHTERGPQLVAKVFPPEHRARADRGIAALQRGSGEHVVRVLDISSTASNLAPVHPCNICAKVNILISSIGCSECKRHIVMR